MAYRETENVRQRKAATRSRLLYAAESLVRQGGFAALQVQALADESGLAVGTVYRYFRGRDELAATVFQQATEREVAALASALTGADSPARRLEYGLTLFADRALRAPRLARALIAEPVSSEVAAQRLHYRHAYAGHFQQVLNEGVDTGVFPPQPVELSANALVGALAEVLAGPLADPAAGPEQAGGAVQLCLRAVGASPADVAAVHESLEVAYEG